MTATTVADLREHSTIREGVVAGSLAAIAVALWFLVVDLIATSLFYTPVRLGRAVAQVLGVPPDEVSDTAAFIGYTIVHFLGFIAIATLAAAIVHVARRQPTVLAGAFVAFIVAEVAIYGFIALLDATDLLQHLTWVQIATGNVIGSAVIGWKLWRDHPGVGGGIGSALGGRV